MQTQYSAPAVVAVLDATDAIKGIAKIGMNEVLDPNAQTSSAAYRDEE
jgi:hypothetical protein